MTRNSTRKKAARDRMEKTGEPYLVAAQQLSKPFGVPAGVGKESCPGHLTWSAFGAFYPDTVCATVIEWEDGHDGWGLCDADDDFREKDIPCPFHDQEGFLEYSFAGGYYLPYWADTEELVPARTAIHFHEEGNSLWMSATHPVHGELKVVVREEPEERMTDDFVPFVMANHDTL